MGRTRLTLLLLLGVAVLVAGCGGTRSLYGVEPVRQCLEDHGFAVVDLGDGFLLASSGSGGVTLRFRLTEAEARREAGRLPAAVAPVAVARNAYYLASNTGTGLTVRACLAESRVDSRAVMAGLPPFSFSPRPTPARPIPLLASGPGWHVVTGRYGAGLVELEASGLTRYHKLALRVEGTRRQRFQGEAVAFCGPLPPEFPNAVAVALARFAGRTPRAFEVPLARGCSTSVRARVRTEGALTAKIVLVGR